MANQKNKFALKPENPLISVIVTVYNVEAYLHKCLDSILNQTYKNLEIILIDDGSKDKSKAICESYVQLDPRVQLISKPNGGVSTARNLGLEQATGDYIIFVDSDDYIHPKMYEHMLDAIYENKADMSICGHNMVYDHESIPIRNDHKTIVYDRDTALRKILLDKEINSYPVDKLCRRELYDDIRFPVGRIFEDTSVMFKTIANSNKIVQINYAYYNYYNKPTSITRKKNIKGNYDNFIAFYERFNYVHENIPDLRIECAQMALTHGMNVVDAFAISGIQPEQQEYYNGCKKYLHEILQKLGGKQGLSRNLKFKISLFTLSPPLYKLTYRIFHWIKSVLR